MPDNSAGARQRSTGYASDVTNISATTSQVGLSDSPRPSLILTRNRSSYNTASRTRPGIRGEPVGAFQVMEDSTVESMMDHEERFGGGSSVKASEKEISAMRQPKFKAGQVKEALFHPISSGSVSSTPQPLSSDTPPAQQSEQSDSDSEVFHQALRSPRAQGSALEGNGSRSQTGFDRIWEWISTRGLVGNNTDYDLLESGGSMKMEGDVKHKHQSTGRRKKTKRARDAKGRLLGPEAGAKGNFTKKRLWRRIWTAMLARPYRSLIIFLIALGLFAYSLTTFLIYFLNPDKAPLPWRKYCATRQPSYHGLTPTKSRRSNLLARISEMTGYASPSKQPLMEIDSSHPAWPWDRSSSSPPHSADDDSVDKLKPVGIFIGIMTIDRASEKRMLIRQTYDSHPKSRVRGTESVSVRFIMGKPKAKYAQDVELENDTFGDIVILDMEENMNSGKTHKYFSWAAENAMVPDFDFVQTSNGTTTVSPKAGGFALVEERTEIHSRGSLDPMAQPIYKGEKRPDYIFKADDDALIILGEMERKLRASPRKLTFFGYLVKNSFMGGECYGMSLDLVRYIADYEPLRKMIKGKEDKLASKWIRMHPQRDEIVWVSERCAIYDHPKSGTVYSHGFLFPNAIEEVRQEDIDQLTPLELQWRGGKHWAATYSTVSHFGSPYTPPFEHMSALQQVEALVEGSEMSLLSRLHAAKHPNAQSVPLWKSEADEAALAEKTYERRPSRGTRFRNDPDERGGTMVVHYIKHNSWFLETALALLGPHNSTEIKRSTTLSPRQ